MDIDLSHIEANLGYLKKLGAFKNSSPELFEFDQFADNQQYVGNILNGDKIDVYIDDGFHSDLSVLTSLRSVLPHFAQNFVCIIEDNCTVAKQLSSEYSELNIDTSGELTILTPQ